MNWGSGFIPILIYASVDSSNPVPPPTDEFWVTDVTFIQMVTPGGTDYVLVG
jgi:hypothetical protein